MADDTTQTEQTYEYPDLTLHGRLTADGTQYRFYVLLNGVELPIQFLNVHDYREAFDAARVAGQEPKAKGK